MSLCVKVTPRPHAKSCINFKICFTELTYSVAYNHHCLLNNEMIIYHVRTLCSVSFVKTCCNLSRTNLNSFYVILLIVKYDLIYLYIFFSLLVISYFSCRIFCCGLLFSVLDYSKQYKVSPHL